MEKPLDTTDSCSTDSSLTVSVVTETYPPEVNGVARSIARMVDGLVTRGHRVRLMRPRQSKADDPAYDPWFRESLFPSLPIPGYPELRLGLPSFARLLREWRRDRPDLVHVVTEGPLGLAAILVARRLGIPVTSDFHTNFDHYSRHYGIGWFKGLVGAYLRWFHNRTDETYVPTREMQSLLSGRAYNGVEVVSRGVDCALFAPHRRREALRAQWGVRPDDVVVGYVGRVAPEKNFDLLLRAYEAIRASLPTARLLVVGDGPLKTKLEKTSAEILFAGMQQGVSLAEHYASADLFLFPSLSETFGNVTLEAMASGLPVVAYDYAAAAEAIDGHSGVKIESGDAEGFVSAAVHLAGRADLRGRFGCAARARAETFDWEAVNDSFERRLVDVARKAARGGSRPSDASTKTLRLRARGR